MYTPQQKNSNVKLLTCSVEANDTGHYRFLVDGRHFKYVSSPPATFRDFDDGLGRISPPILLGEILPPFPIGNWNKGLVARDPFTRQITFKWTEEVLLDGVNSGWNTVKFDELEFSCQRNLRGQRIQVVTHPRINGGELVLMKLAIWPDELERMEREIAVYQRICDKGVGPKFLGQVTEGPNGRVIGFIAEWMNGARYAGPWDFNNCRKVLARLHHLGIKHGSVKKQHLIVREGPEGHEAVLIDFDVSKLDCSRAELEDEMNTLKGRLESTDPIGMTIGPYIVRTARDVGLPTWI
ncbi:hypothetical protein E4U17_004836 [Claviceps sp. LM77 group G4]|nr:hypothetical protein E4U17_004836 [Claviceps sp. LM77 group G4]KAG6069039.1 hypothetical protein E4U33_004946 [Claviceps sp. LM78 group G4]KAG6073257.1 hypothetical protein E4U16_004800 [Claviceps sp. LM84 group G4]